MGFINQQTYTWPHIVPNQVLHRTAKTEDPESLSAAAAMVESTVRDMVTNYFPLNSREYQRTLGWVDIERILVDWPLRYWMNLDDIHIIC
jgi:hypothetical protein